MTITMNVYEDNASDAALKAQENSEGILTLSSLFVERPIEPTYFNSPPAHTWAADEMYPMLATYSFDLTDPRAIPIPENVKHVGIYFKHFLSAGDNCIGKNEAMWDFRMLVLGLVPDGTSLKPITVMPEANYLRNTRTLDIPHDYSLIYFEYMQDTSGYQHVLSNMLKGTVPPGVSHIYPLFRYSNAAAYPPLPGPLTFHVRFW